MIISIITVCYNSENTINETVESIYNQSYKNFEYIVIDGSSKDKTIEIIQSYRFNNLKIISEPDLGIYDAMNKGFSMASGDIICFLNSDDRYIDKNIFFDVIHSFNSNKCDFVYGDVNMTNNQGKLIRQWIVGDIMPFNSHFSQIPHPCFFIKRSLLLKLLKPFDDSYRIAADLKQQLLLISKFGARGYYLKKPLVEMKLGGESTRNFRSYFLGWIESRRAFNDVNGSGGFLFVVEKVFTKIKTIRSLNFFNIIFFRDFK